MNNLIGMILSLTFASSALAVELTEATNEQLLAELSRRLDVRTFTVSAVCEYNYLKVATFDKDGRRISDLSHYFQTAEFCERARASLSFGSRARVAAGDQFASCSFSYMEVQAVETNGNLKRLSSTYKGSLEDCVDAMVEYNR